MAQSEHAGSYITGRELPISDVEIKSFRGISELKLSFGDVNVIYGKAGTGKSSLLEALFILSNGMLMDAVGTPIVSQIPRKLPSAVEDPSFLINVSQDESLITGWIGKNRLELQLLKDWMKLVDGLGSEAEVPVTNIRTSMSSLLGNQPLRYVTYRLKSNDKLARVGAITVSTYFAPPSVVGFPPMSIPSRQENITSNVIPYNGPLQLESRALLLREPGERLVDVFTRVITQGRKEELLKKLADIFEERSGEVSDVNLVNNKILVTIASLPKPIEAQSLAAGYLRAIEMISSLNCLDEGKALLIEEPEIHVNPALFSKLISVLISSALEKGLQLFIVTHNPEIAMNIVNRYRESGGEASGRRLVSIWMRREKGEIKADVYGGKLAERAIQRAAEYDLLN